MLCSQDWLIQQIKPSRNGGKKSLEASGNMRHDAHITLLQKETRPMKQSPQNKPFHPAIKLIFEIALLLVLAGCKSKMQKQSSALRIRAAQPTATSTRKPATKLAKRATSQAKTTLRPKPVIAKKKNYKITTLLSFKPLIKGRAYHSIQVGGDNRPRMINIWFEDRHSELFFL